ncbi:MAG: hypothetical protein LBN21_10120 [Treponema sp.]|nr:hypothetical protein [Treponema sp.]
MLFLFLLVLAGQAGALDLRVIGGVGNLAFSSEQESSLGAADADFEPAISPYVLVGLEGDYSDIIGFSAAFDRDPIMRNRLLTNISLNLGYLRLDAGPFLGLFNTEEQPLNTGLSAGVGVEFPGIIFGSVKAAATIGSLAGKTGEYVQQTGDISVGFWVPHVICTFSLQTQIYSDRVSTELLTKDESTRYQFSADTFSKNVPYTIQVNMGYQSLKRSYIPQGNAAVTVTTEDDGAGGYTSVISSVESETDEFKSLYIGFEGTWRIVPRIRLVLGAEMPVYSWGKDPLGTPDRDIFIFQARAGLVWTLPEKVK